MYMESPIVRARELRRHDLLQDAARHRMAVSAIDSSGNDLRSRIRPTWIDRMCRSCVSLSQRLRAASLPFGSAAAPMAKR